MTTPAILAFSQNYAEARAKFLDLCAQNGFAVRSLQCPARGPGGAKVYMDVAVRGPEKPRKALLVMCGTHGVEGFAGSGVINASLADGLYAEVTDDTRVMLIHAINPYGFAWISRSNEDGVDICRNFVDAEKPPLRNAAYDALMPFLTPANWKGPSREAADAGLDAYFEAHGEAKALSDIAIGQYAYWDGIFFGGEARVWSARRFEEIVKAAFLSVEMLACVDYHTGLGPYGYGEMLVFHANESDSAKRAAGWWGDRAKIVKAGQSSAYDLTGGILDGLERALPGVPIVAGALEFGTRSMRVMIDALRADHWLRCHGDPNSPFSDEIRGVVRDAFYCDEDSWKEMVVEQGQLVQRQALRGLAQR